MPHLFFPRRNTKRWRIVIISVQNIIFPGIFLQKRGTTRALHDLGSGENSLVLGDVQMRYLIEEFHHSCSERKGKEIPSSYTLFPTPHHFQHIPFSFTTSEYMVLMATNKYVCFRGKNVISFCLLSLGEGHMVDSFDFHQVFSKQPNAISVSYCAPSSGNNL